MNSVSVLDNWFLIALLTPAAWALSCLIDVCFVGGGVYRRPSEGALLSGLFSALPLALALGYSGAWQVPADAYAPAIAAGVCYFLHLYFFFKALFALNDAASIETFNTLSVLFVPPLAFVLLGEVLSPALYLAIGVALLGVAVLCCGHLRGAGRAAIGLSLASVLCVSLAMVAQARVLQLTDYWPAVALFSATSMACALALALLTASARRTVELCRRFGGVFIVAELLQQVAVLSSQRATALAPSVSLVAVVECALPLFVILFSLVAVAATRRGAWLSVSLQRSLAMQADGLAVKSVALAMIVVGVVLAQLGASPPEFLVND